MISSALLCVFAAAPALAEQPAHVIADRGSTSYLITLERFATDAEANAARELQRFIREISGTIIPIAICQEGEGEDSMYPHEIVIGWSGYDKSKIGYAPRLTRIMQKYDVKVNLGQLGSDGFFIATAGPHLLIAGGRPRGTLYGVYTFLEKYLGCRWYDSMASMIPRRETLAVGPVFDVQVPVFRQRYICWGDFRHDPDLAARNKVNQEPGVAWLSDVHGGTFGWLGGHTFEQLLPSKKYFAEHPDYYALVEGKRKPTQYCLTNPEVLRVVTDNLKQWMRENPSVEVFSVCQNDGVGYCTCPNCKALDDQEESQQGSLLTFINNLADSIKDDFPGKYIATFAYAYSEKAPKTIKPRPNVIIRLCTFCCCSIYNYETDGYSCSSYTDWAKGGPRPGPTFAENMKRWGALTKNIFIWDYPGSLCHHLAPTPNLNRLGPNLRFLAANGASGYFAQPPDWHYGNMGGLNALRAWLLAKLAWDPSFDTESGIDEFVTAYYGSAAEPIRKYIDMIHSNAPAHDTHKPGSYDNRLAAWFHAPADQYWLKPELLEQYAKLFDEAEKLTANDPCALRRVRIARLGVQYAQIRMLPPTDARRPEIITRFFEGMQLGGIKTVGGFIIPGQTMTTLQKFREHLDKGGQ